MRASRGGSGRARKRLPSSRNAIIAIEGTELAQQPLGLGQCRSRRQIEKAERRGIRYAPLRQVEHEAGEIRRENFRAVRRLERCGLRLLPQPVADARLQAPGAAAPLVGGSARHTNGFEPGQADFRLVARHPGEPAIHHDAHALDGERRLRDRGCEYDLAPAGRGRCDCPLLHLGLQRAMERRNVDRLLGDALAQDGLGAADFGAPRKKGQHRTGLGAHCPRDRIRYLRLDRALRVTAEVAGRNREGAAGAFDHRHITEQPAHAGAIDGRRHDEKLEVGAQALLHIACERQAEISVERALVKLVEHDGGDALERRVRKHLTREYALGDKLDAGRRRDPRAETDAVTDRRTDGFAQGCRHAGGSGAGGEPARFEHNDLPSACPFLGGEDERDPRRLAGAGRGHQHRGRARTQGGGELRQHGVDWKRLAHG